MAKSKVPDDAKSLEEWWALEARAMNESGEWAREQGIVIDTNEGLPPPLNPDGSLADEVEPE